MGGRIAMTVAPAEPERVDRLVLVSASPSAAGARRLVRAGMLVAELPLLRGRHRQPRQVMRAQFDATTRFDPALAAQHSADVSLGGMISQLVALGQPDRVPVVPWPDIFRVHSSKPTPGNRSGAQK